MGDKIDKMGDANRGDDSRMLMDAFGKMGDKIGSLVDKMGDLFGGAKLGDVQLARDSRALREEKAQLDRERDELVRAKGQQQVQRRELAMEKEQLTAAQEGLKAQEARLQRSTFASADGSASVRLGDSAAVAGVRAQAARVQCLEESALRAERELAAAQARVRVLLPLNI